MNRNRVYKKRKRYDFVEESSSNQSSMMPNFLKCSVVAIGFLSYVGCKMHNELVKFEQKNSTQTEHLIQHSDNTLDVTHSVVLDSIPASTSAHKAKADEPVPGL